MQTLSHLRNQTAGHTPSLGFVWDAAAVDARAHAPPQDRLRLLMASVATADALMVFLVSGLIFLLSRPITMVMSTALLSALLASAVTANVFTLIGAYRTPLITGMGLPILKVTLSWSVIFAVIVMIEYVSRTPTDHFYAYALLWYISVLFGFSIIRLGASAFVHHWRTRGRLVRTVAIVDLAGGGNQFAERLSGGNDGTLCIAGVFLADNAEQDLGETRSSVSDLIEITSLHRIDEVLILVPNEISGVGRSNLRSILARLGNVPTTVKLCAAAPSLVGELAHGNPSLSLIPTVTIHRRPMDAWSTFGKRAEDLVIGSLALLVTAPIMSVIALMVKLESRGPILFKQARQGHNNNVFTVLKFRTMTHQPHSEGPLVQATRNDLRFTRIGRFLRRTSLDELPQILNVLTGEMSLVGPRPHAVVHNSYYAALIEDYLGRHRVQPGITGWAQINGHRGATETVEKMQQRLEFDLFYINNWSLALDLKILLRTVTLILFDRHAY